MPRPSRIVFIMANRRDEALAAAEATLGAYETGHIGPVDLARNAYRVARLLDDADAEAWIGFEVGGFPRDGSLPPDAWTAACRSGRDFTDAGGTRKADTRSLGQLVTEISVATSHIQAASDRPVSITSANPGQWVGSPVGNSLERMAASQQAVNAQGVLDRVTGSIFEYVVARYHELRFGSAVETAFEVVRAEVDSLLALLVPDAPQRLAAAFESVGSANPEHWAAAAATCRRLLVSAADQLRPPGPEVAGRRMGPENYVNRLVDWITRREISSTMGQMISGELEHLGRRLDAAADAGNTGAHGEVSRYAASRYLTGTYLLLGDILRLAAPLDGSTGVGASPS